MHFDRLHTTLGTLALAGALALLGAAPAAAAPRFQATARLHRGEIARSAPGAGRRVMRLRAYEPITFNTTVLPVIGRRVVGHTTWLRVLLPKRPDGSAGWINAKGVTLGRTSWRIVVRTGSHRVVVYHNGQVTRRFSAVVGKRSTPTPHGSFFVTEIVSVGRATGGPWALATSAYSNVLQQFDGGPGQVAIHGRINLPDPLGTASSHGCVRLANQDISWLAHHVRPGTPIQIRG